MAPPFLFYLQVKRPLGPHTEGARGRSGWGATSLLPQWTHWGSFSSSLRAKGLPHLLQSYFPLSISCHPPSRSRPVFCRAIIRRKKPVDKEADGASSATEMGTKTKVLFSLAGILPARGRSGFYPEPREHVLHEEEPDDDQGCDQEEAFHALLQLVDSLQQAAGKLLFPLRSACNYWGSAPPPAAKPHRASPLISLRSLSWIPCCLQQGHLSS